MEPEGERSKPEQAAARKASDDIYENVEAVASVYERVEQTLPLHQRGIERLVRALGRPLFLYCYLGCAFIWIVANLLAPSAGVRPLDVPPFFWLQGVVTLSALCLTTVILITQNRQGRLTEQRAHFDLQVNLLAERKIAKIIALLEELRRDSPTIKDRYDGVAEAMQHPADPQQVVEALESTSDLKR